MKPVDAIVSEAALLSFASPEPAAGAGDVPPLIHPPGGHHAPFLAEAKEALVDALATACRAGHSLASVNAASAAAYAACAAVRLQISERVAAAALHNGGEEGPDAPWILLPLDDALLTHFVNRVHSEG